MVSLACTFLHALDVLGPRSLMSHISQVYSLELGDQGKPPNSVSRALLFTKDNGKCLLFVWGGGGEGVLVLN